MNGNDFEKQSQIQNNTEVVKKDKRHVSITQLIAIVILCSVLSGAIVFGSTKLLEKNNADSSVQSTNSLENQDTQSTSPTKSNTVVLTESEGNQVTAVAEKLSPSVVGIKTTITLNDFFIGQGSGSGEGSGVIYSSDGYIITNNHVIEGALDIGTNNLSKDSKIEVILPGKKEDPYLAKVVGRDIKTDIAVLKIDAKDLPVAELGDSDTLKVGELAVAIGNPGGLEFMGTVSAGIISGLNRIVEIDMANELSLIQTDTAINPGNSGGPLCNSKGQVIGIINIKIVATGFEGIGFAIPINQAKEITDGLIQGGYIKGRPLLGISVDITFDEEKAEQYDVPAGVLISDVQLFSGAAVAGIMINDIIVKFDGQEVKTFNDLKTLINEHNPGDTVEIEVYRNSEKANKIFSVTLTEDVGTSTN